MCTIQVATNDTHTDPDEARADTGNKGRVSAVTDTVTYNAGEDEDQYLCSHIEFDGKPTLYWDAAAGDWSASSSVVCGLALSAEIPDPGPVGGEVDPIVCPLLSVLFPPQGDVVVPVVGNVNDCPPYDGDELSGPGLAVAFVYPEATEPR